MRPPPDVTIGRNDPCPCGSGRRYKVCHGTIGAASTTATAPATGSASAPATGSADALAQRGLDAHRRGDVEAALRDYREALARDPEHPLALHYLGVVLYQRGQARDALPLLECAVARVPQEAEFHNNLGLVLAALDRNDEAVAAHRAAIALRPGHVTAWNNLGLALQAMNRLPDAIDAYRHALAGDPAFAHAHWNLALALLAHGDYGEGWREYEWRLRLPELGGNAPRPPAPRWLGEDLAGRSVLVTTEQGLGDAIQFIRFAERLAARGAQVTIETGGTLAKLLATAPGVAATRIASAPGAHSVSTRSRPRTSVGASETPFDFSIPLLSLPQVLGIGAGDLGCAPPYLRVDAALRAQAERAARSAVSAQIAAPAAAGARRAMRHIGLAWAGSPGNANDRHRSIALARLAPLLALPDIAWFSLQKGAAEDEIAALPAAAAIHRLDLRNDFDGTAALVASLDAVVSVDTSIAHLAGALGIPVSILLPFAPDWRWGITGARTPWYPTARLIRQPAAGDWAGAVAALATSLRGAASRRDEELPAAG